MTAKIKLSDKQKEVVKYMRQGYCLTKNVTYVHAECGLIKCSTATFFKLCREQLIEKTGKFVQGFGQPYQLTQLGKEMEL